MATDATTPETTTETTVAGVPEQSYSLAELKANAKAIFDVQPEVIDGALYNNPKQEFTVSELTKLIIVFLKRKVK